MCVDRRVATGSLPGATPGEEPIACLVVRVRAESIEGVVDASGIESRNEALSDALEVAARLGDRRGRDDRQGQIVGHFGMRAMVWDGIRVLQGPTVTSRVTANLSLQSWVETGPPSMSVNVQLAAAG